MVIYFPKLQIKTHGPTHGPTILSIRDRKIICLMELETTPLERMKTHVCLVVDQSEIFHVIFAISNAQLVMILSDTYYKWVQVGLNVHYRKLKTYKMSKEQKHQMNHLYNIPLQRKGYLN